MLLCLAAAMLLAALVPGRAGAVLVSAKNGRLASFSGGVYQLNATLTAVPNRYAADRRTFAANYAGAATTGVARGSLTVNWSQGQSVAYGAAFLLPAGFHTGTVGQQALLTWSTPPGADGSFERGGVVIDYSDDLAYLVDDTESGQTIAQRTVAGPFTLPTGQWFTLQVRQLLGSGTTATSRVFLDGMRVASTRGPNFLGTQIDHVDYGIVELTGGAEESEVSLGFDRAFASGYSGYASPFGTDTYTTGRTDMGVDFCMRRGEPIRAVGDGIVVGISPDWFASQPYIWYQLLDGPYAGRYVYVAEQIGRLAHIGAPISAGQTLARYKRAGTCIETGWSAADGATRAQATTGYYEGEVTHAGVAFAHFLVSLGVRGPFELRPSWLGRERRLGHAATAASSGPDPAPVTPR